MRCVARFGTICTILKTVKNTHGRVLLLVKLLLCNTNAAGFTFPKPTTEAPEQRVNSFKS